MTDDITLLDHLNPELGTPWNDPATFDLYERNFGVTLPATFSTVMSKHSNAVISAIYRHPELKPDDNEFYIWRFASIGRHRYNEPNDLLVRSEYEHHNNSAIPKKAIVFAFDYRGWPIYLDLNAGGEGRIAVHENSGLVPRPTWANLEHEHPCAYIADGLSQYIGNLTSDPNPPI